MSFYHLVRLQNNDDNRRAYQIVRIHTASHQNAFFQIVDRALEGADASRDAGISVLLNQWLQRPGRDHYTDLTHVVPVCGAQACNPLPIALRPATDYLWQRSSFQLSGGSSQFIETAGIDYILPYWMGRYYGVIPGTAPTGP